MLEAIRYVDLVIPQENIDKKTDVKKYEVDIFVETKELDGLSDYLKKYCQVIYLDRTMEISTSKIKREIKIFDVENK